MKRPILFLLVCMTIAVAVYWPGLSGGFLLDDDANLAPVWRWLSGDIGWLQVVLENGSGPLGRPVSMLSFVANAAVSDQSAFGFKLGNLGLHLATGSLIFLFLAQLIRRDHMMADRAVWLAALIAATWLLHPLFSSTVLYVVQRMAILSAFFTVAGLCVFLYARNLIEGGHFRSGAAWLLVGVPVLTAIAAFSKENGVLLPALCGLIECLYFRPSNGQKRPGSVKLFFALFLVIPSAIVSVYLLTNHSVVTRGFENRPFDLVERLLTEMRILFDYVGHLLLPVGQSFSLYRDNYTVSTGLLTPASTLWALIGWIGLLTAAFLARRQVPAFTAGLGLFLIGHSMESSFYPLALYFEHRNYLPAIGILLAAASLLVYAGRLVSTHMDHPDRVFGAAVAGLLVTLSFATFARAIAWQSPIRLVEQSVQRYPDSRFGRMELAAQIMNSGPLPDFDRATDQYRHLQSMERPSTRAIGYLGEIAVDCHAFGVTETEHLERAFEKQPETLQPDFLKAVVSVGTTLRQGQCQGVTATALADRVAHVADETHLSQGSRTVWRLRFEAAQLYASQSEDRKALEQARIAWDTGQADLPVGMLIAALHIRMGEFGAAARMLDEIGPRIPEHDQTGQALLGQYREAIDEGARNSSLSPIFDD